MQNFNVVLSVYQLTSSCKIERVFDGVKTIDGQGDEDISR